MLRLIQIMNCLSDASENDEMRRKTTHVHV